MEKDKDKVKMKRVSGTTKYIDFKAAQEGDVLVDGWYVGEVDGKYGMQHEFKDLEGNIVVVGGGHLNYLVDKHLNPSTRCRVIFEGHEVMAKGKFSGKEVKKFALELEDVEPVLVPKSEDVKEETPPWEEKKPTTRKARVTKVRAKEPAPPTEDDDDDMFGEL